ncbi:hypothetical protein SynBMKMC1_01623 [Synechococcus sp. BMK-MC-1]|nr:hypothetical protein SynBMKMC1_01623 [Synechococcus sp. BMK-MC-1]
MHQPSEAPTLLKGPIRDLGEAGRHAKEPDQAGLFQLILRLAVAVARASRERTVKNKKNW